MSTQPVQLDVRTYTSGSMDVYRQVAQEPHRSYHFEMGRALAEKAST
jgi:hypothetical protein